MNGVQAGQHEGGYTPFTVDITPLLSRRPRRTWWCRPSTILRDLTKPRGKQDWQLQPHAIWYPRTTGIWQTVWYEIGPGHPHPAAPVDVEPRAVGARPRGRASPATWSTRARGCACNLTIGDKVIADDTYSVANNEVHRRIALSDPGIDDYRNELLWSPESPRLIEARLELSGGSGESSRCGRELHRASLGDDAARSLHVQRSPLLSAPGARSGLLARDAASPRRTTLRCGRMSSWRRRSVSTASASTRKSRIRDTSTGPIGSA